MRRAHMRSIGLKRRRFGAFRGREPSNTQPFSSTAMAEKRTKKPWLSVQLLKSYGSSEDGMASAMEMLNFFMRLEHDPAARFRSCKWV